jgi:hypothetical protein
MSDYRSDPKMNMLYEKKEKLIKEKKKRKKKG